MPPVSIVESKNKCEIKVGLEEHLLPKVFKNYQVLPLIDNSYL